MITKTITDKNINKKVVSSKCALGPWRFRFLPWKLCGVCGDEKCLTADIQQGNMNFGTDKGKKMKEKRKKKKGVNLKTKTLKRM
jgi:hypothetical protein